ncbi:MAG: hypothetical protein IKU45_04010 [Clostridia bacterium]|nr:hypothetical protein [Clostridia bacterium]
MNDKNLIPNSKRSPTEVRKNGAKGGIASGEARRRKRAFRELIEDMLDEDGGTVNGQPATKKDLVVARAIKMLTSTGTKDQDFLKAFEIIRDTIGEKPVERIVVAEVSQDIIDEVEAAVMDDEN